MVMTTYRNSFFSVPPAGDLNDLRPVTEPHFTSDTDGNKVLDYILEKVTSKDVIAKHNGEFYGIVFKAIGESNVKSSNNASIGIPGMQSVQNEKLTAYRVYIPEFTSRVMPDDFYNCSPSIAHMHDLVPFLESPILNVGDIVVIRFRDKNALSDPIGLKKVSTEPLDLNKVSPTKTLENVGGIPQVERRVLLLAKSPNFGRQLPIPTAGQNCNISSISGFNSSDSNRSIQGEDPKSNWRDCWSQGTFIGQLEIIKYENILFPKRYIPALDEMRKAYKRELGKDLKMSDGYRDNRLQAQWHACWAFIKKLNDQLETETNPQRIASGKEPIPLLPNKPAIGPVSGTGHVTGKAVDFVMEGDKGWTKDWPASSKKDGRRPDNAQHAFSLVNKGTKPIDTQKMQSTWKDAPYGITAWWLSINSIKYGFVWTGWSFGELWHYEFAENYCPPSLIDQTAVLKSPEEVVREESTRIFEKKCK